MKIIIPQTISFTSTAPTTSDPSVWSSGSSYTVGATCSVAGSINKIYKCIIAVSPGGSSPEIDVNNTTPKWALVSYTNRYQMFDYLRDTSTNTITETSFSVTATVAASNSLCVVGMTGITQVVVASTSPSYSKTFNIPTNSDGSMQYKEVILFDMPNCTIITVTFYGTAPISVGNLVIGNYYYIGSVQIGAVSDFLNFSDLNRQEFGDATLKKRRGVPKLNAKIYIDKSKVDSLTTLKTQLESVPVLWSGLDDQMTHNYFSAMVILGIYKAFNFEIDNPAGCMINVELEDM